MVDLAVACALSERGWDVTVVARGGPYETDVTASEASRLLDEVAARVGCGRRPRVVSTGSSYPAAALPLVSEEARRAVTSSDAAVFKGIANLEALMEFEPRDRVSTVVALRAKCPVVARLLATCAGCAYVGVGYP